MSVMVAHPQDIRPPSPALTDPDMILPYDPKEQEVLDEALAPTSTGAELTPPQTQQQTLPGSWLSDHDIPSSQPKTTFLRQPDVPITKLKSPVGRFLNTLDPKMRQGIGIEVPEYSPSIYSPTDPGGRTPETVDTPYKTGFPPASPDDTKIMFEDASEESDDDVMGTRAEEILANAKKRLLAMETNLNRARTLSLGTTQSEANSPVEPVAYTNMVPRSSNGNTNHLRITSDSKLSSVKPVYDPTIRSASALGSPNPFSSFIHNHRHLEPLNEDDLIGTPPADYDRPKTSMKELQEQMDNLKGKINSLKERSREDSLRRRSMQALKVPSPFTDADIPGAPSPFIEHMRPESNSSDRSAEFLGNPSAIIKEFDSPAASPLVKFKPEDGESSHGGTFLEDETKEDGAVYGQQGDRRSIVNPRTSEHERPAVAAQAAIFDHVESEEPESMIPSSPTYETDFLNPELPAIPAFNSPAHEDRPDAFDYETYVLNSTMGSYSRTGFRSRSGSISTAGSGSTQRPTHELEQDATRQSTTRAKHLRTDSSDSTSTTATFATAITGHDSRANSRASRHKGANAPQYLSPTLPPKSSYTSLRQAVAHNLGVPESPLKRNSFSPLASPNVSSFAGRIDLTTISPAVARAQILSILLRSASSPSSAGDNDQELTRCWAPEDEALVGTVIDGLVKVVGRVASGDDQGGAGRSVLESIGAVLQK